MRDPGNEVAQHTQTVLHTHCLLFAWGDFKSPEKMKTMLMQNCLRILGWGGVRAARNTQTKCLMGDVEMENAADLT